MSLRERVKIGHKIISCLYHTDEVAPTYRYLFGQTFNKENLIKITINGEEININNLVDNNGAPGGWRWQFPGVGDYFVKFYLKDDVSVLDYMFYDVDKLVSCQFYNFNKNEITHMIGMFQDFSNLISVDFIDFNAYKIKNLTNIFNACPKLNKVNFGKNFRTHSLIESANMFNNCKAISVIDMRYLDFSKCTFFNKMWANCSNLSKLYLNTTIDGVNSDISTNLFLNSTKEGAILYYDFSKVGASLLGDFLPSNWIQEDFRTYEDL